MATRFDGTRYFAATRLRSSASTASTAVASPAIEGVPALMFVPRNQLVHNGTCVVEASFSSRSAPHVFAGRSFDTVLPGFKYVLTATVALPEEDPAPAVKP